MDTSGKSLLSKWSLKDTGIKSSLISTGLQSNVSGGKSSGFESKLPAGPLVGASLSTTRKRKPLTTKSSIEDKKPLVEKPHLKSSLLGSSSLLTSGSLKSSLLGSSTLSSKTPPPSSLSSKTQTRSSHVTPQSRPLSGSLLGNTAATSLLSGYTTSALSSTLSAGRSLQGQDTSLTNQKVSVLSHASVLTNQQPVGRVSLQSSFLMTSSKLPTGLSDSKPKGTKEKSGQSQAKQKSKKRAADDRLEFDKYKAKAPRYDLRKVIPEEKGVEVPKFVNPSKDPSLNRPAIPLHDVNGLKLALINAVSGSLICQPDFSKSNDLTRRALSEMSERVVTYDPEFILKVALYTRKELNIRTTANFLLALCSNVEVCRPYLKKYYCASIQLPSDWIEVAEIYQAFHDTNLSHGSLPAALRKAMIMKFPEFDQYQLAKYNKESSMKKKKKKEKKETESVRGRGGNAGVRGRGGRGGVRGRGGAMRGRDARNVSTNQRGNWDSDSNEESDEEENIHRQLSDVVYDEEDHTQEEMEKIKFSIKQLIRKLHIIEPVDHVMSIIGKKYPDTLEAFYKSRLPGEWDQDRAGKRMKLPVPETWETQVSLKGNKASTWEDLIDHKKLPFMAMLRNLRNLIKAGISQKHHQQVLRRLTDERQVANSKQFPFRFFSAYEVLSGLEKEYETTQKKLVELAEMEASGIPRSQAAPRGGRGRGRGRGRGGKGDNWWIEKKNKQKEEKRKPKETAFDKAIINRYKKALDTAVKIATVYNVQPIRGRTIVLSDCSDRMRVNCTAARGLGKPRQMLEVALLMGLMCKYSCEECEFVTFKETTWEQASIQPGTILDNLDNLLKKINFPEVSGKTEKMPNGFPESILMEKLRDRIQVDNIVILSGGDLAATQQKILSNFLKKYRQIVNPNLLYVNISFAGKGCGFSQSIKPEHDNDIYISGYSDAILRFIAERGEGGQLIHVEKIDEAFNLKPLAGIALENSKTVPVSKPEKPLVLLSGKLSWRKTRVFISSTFRDMHGERDVLTRFVFPELRALGRKHFINIQEVDLRWGITEEESNRAIELCLSEVMTCEFFMGILGNRYGYVPDNYNVPDMEEFDWLKTYPPNASVTELEMHLGALSNPSTRMGKAFFYIRDDSFERDLPKELHSEFMTENPQVRGKLEDLKTQVEFSGFEVYKGYPCHWGGVIDGKPMVAGLEKFAVRVLNNLWNAIKKAYPDEEAILDENIHVAKQHEAVVESHKEKFVGRKKLIKECVAHIIERKSNIIALNGKAGTGKTALLSAIVHSYIENPQCDGAHSVLVHVVGAAPGSTNIVATLRRLCYELRRQFAVDTEIPEDFKNLTQKFGELLEEGAASCSSPLVIFIDGLDMMENTHQPYNLEWLPQNLSKNVVFVMTTLDGGKCHRSLKRRPFTEVIVGGLDMFDKAEVVRNNLAVYRKKLDESPFKNQMKFLMGKKDAGNPLFLKLACEELRVFGKFEMVTSKLKSLPQTVPQMLQEVLSRLESDLGQEVVSLAMCLLVCSRDGLMPEELHDLLSLHDLLDTTNYTADTVYNILLSPDKMMPAAAFSHLCRSLQTFLNPHENTNTCLSLAHLDVAAAVRSRYMKSSHDKESGLHRLMAGYFLQLVDPDHDGSYNGNSIRGFSELPYHLAYGGEFKVLVKVLCSLEFISNKCRLGLGKILLEDYQEKEFTNRTMERDQQKVMGLHCYQEYKMFVSRNIHLLNEYPSLTWQQAINDIMDSEPYKDGTKTLDSAKHQSETYFRWSNRPQTEDPNYLTLSNLPQPVTCVAISKDNAFFVCGGLDCVVHLHDLETGKEVRSFHGHADVITDVCFAGRSHVCSASLDNNISVWHLDDGHRIHILKGHKRRVQSIASDVSGKTLASASWDCTVKVWNVMKGECVCDLKVGSPVNAVSFHPEGQLIVTGMWDSTLKIWDVFHKTRRAVLRGHNSSVRDVAYSPCGRYIASAALDGDVKLWESQKGTQVGNVRGHSLPINKLTFSPTGRNLITVSDDHKIKVWSGHMGKPLQCLGTENDGPVKSVALSPDGETLAVGYHEGFIRFYDVATGSLMNSSNPHSAAVRRLSFSPCGNYLVSASADCIATVFSMPGSVVATMVAGSPLMCVTVSKHYIAVGTEDNQCLVYPSVSSKTKGGRLKEMLTLRGQTGPITSCTFNSDVSKLATASRDASVYIWDVLGCLLDPTNPAPVQKLHACHSDWITDCQWSNIGDYLVTGSVDFNLKVWDVKTGEEKFKLTGHMASITSVRFSYGCIVSACSDGSVKVWSQKGTEITTLHGHTQCANDCALVVKVSESSEVDEEEEVVSDWSAEPKETKPGKKKPKIDMEDVLVASCSDDGTVRLWNPLQANELANLTGHDDRILSVASDSHGNLCTSSLDKSIRLWKPTLSSETATSCHDAPVTFTSVSSDGDSLLTGSRDGYVKLWRLHPDTGDTQLVQSLKVHAKSVNTGCFVGHDGKKFVTGGDDEMFYEWKCQGGQGGAATLMRKVNRYKMKSPVTCVVWHKASKASSGQVVVSAEWDRARVTVINTDQKSPLKTIELGSVDSGSWVMNMMFQGQELTVMMSDSMVQVLQLTGSLSPKGTCELSVTKKNDIKCVADIKQKVPEHKLGLNMILCGAVLDKEVKLSGITEKPRLLGDCKGQLTILFRDCKPESLKIHERDVTCVKVVNGLVLTSSLDRSVKAWRIDCTRSYTTPQQVLSEGLEQMGLFLCPAPVTSMEIVEGSDQNELICGDELGNIHFFVVEYHGV